MAERFPDFRLGTVLATSFTATLTERCGDPVERIPVPQRLLDWLALQGLAVGSCSATELDHAREVREAIHAVATARALERTVPQDALGLLNTASTHGRAAPVLTTQGERRWQLGPPPSVADAVQVIAADAIAIVSGESEGRLSLCASPTCRAAFFDTSRSRSRRWCDMNTCGNREKKQRFLARHQTERG